MWRCFHKTKLSQQYVHALSDIGKTVTTTIHKYIKKTKNLISILRPVTENQKWQKTVIQKSSRQRQQSVRLHKEVSCGGHDDCICIN